MIVFFINPCKINPFTPTDLYGMSQIKAWAIPFYILWIEWVRAKKMHSITREY